ncbi:hypothetical protein ACS127_06585 [Amphibacillus sp. Q70]|uniref:hypothetical protein n=1 Tax=Amphibacillus sp. Q70 TaxID=3453416 RepID=UPI003F83C4D0
MLFNIPIFALAVLIFINRDLMGTAILFGIPMVILFALLFIPNTYALFACVRDWVVKKDQSANKSYLSHMISFYKNNLPSGFILTFIWLVWLADFYFFLNKNDLLMIIFFLIGILLIVMTINYFSLGAHYYMKNRELIKNAIYLTVGRPLLFVLILIINTSLYYFSLTRFIILIVFFTGSVSAYLSFLVFYNVTLKIKNEK